jgi:hypothetical protein
VRQQGGEEEIRNESQTVDSKEEKEDPNRERDVLHQIESGKELDVLHSNAAQPTVAEGRLLWYRFSRLALDVIPDILRGVVRSEWEIRYGLAWIDGAEEHCSSHLFVHGGPVSGVYDRELPGTFEIKPGKAVNFALTSEDTTKLQLAKGAPVMIGGVKFTVRSDKNKDPPTGFAPYTNDGGSQTPGRIYLAPQLVKDGMKGFEGKTASWWVPAATRHDGGALDPNVKKLLESGEMETWDTTALGCALLGSVGCLLEWSGVDIIDEVFWERVANGTLVSGGGGGEEKGGGGGGMDAAVAGNVGKAHVVRRIIQTRNVMLGHRHNSNMSETTFKDAVRLYRVAMGVFGAPPELVARFNEVLKEHPGEVQLNKEIKLISLRLEKMAENMAEARRERESIYDAVVEGNVVGNETLAQVNKNMLRIDELMKKPPLLPLLHFVVQRYPALTAFVKRDAVLDECLLNIWKLLDDEDDDGNQRLEMHLSPATREGLMDPSLSDRVIGGLFWAAIGFGDVPAMEEPVDLSIEDFFGRILPVPRFVVLCFKHGAREAAKRLRELDDGAGKHNRAILWIKFDILANEDHTCYLIEKLISPITRFALQRSGPSRRELEEKVQRCGEAFLRECGEAVLDARARRNFFDLEINEDPVVLGGGGEGGGKLEEEQIDLRIPTGASLEQGRSKIVSHRACKPRNWGLGDIDELRGPLKLCQRDIGTLKQTIQGLKQRKDQGVKMTCVGPSDRACRKIAEIDDSDDAFVKQVQMRRLDDRSRAVGLEVCRSFLHTRRFDVIVCIRTVEDLERFKSEEEPNERALCWVDLSGDGPQVGVHGGDEKGGEANIVYGDSTVTLESAMILARSHAKYRVLVTGKAVYWKSINDFLREERTQASTNIHELGDGLSGNPAAGLHEEIKLPGLESTDETFKCSLRDAFIAAGGKSPAADLQACLEDVLFRCVVDEGGEWQGSTTDAIETKEGKEGKEGKEDEEDEGDDTTRPPACICGVYVDGECDIMVRICIRDVAFLQLLRGAVLSGIFELKLNAALKRCDEEQRERGEIGVLHHGNGEDGDDGGLLRVREVDRSDFARKYESSMLSLDTLTTHQEEKLRDIRQEDGKGQHVHVRAPAGAGKTFVALHYILGELQKSYGAGADGGGNGGYVLFVARNRPLAFFVARWIWARIKNEAPSKKGHVWEHLHILTAPADDSDDDGANRRGSGGGGGPALIPYVVSEDTENNRIVFKPCKNFPYDLVVVDEAHHVYRDAALAALLENMYMRNFEGRRVVLSDMSQALTGKIKYPDGMKGALAWER